MTIKTSLTALIAAFSVMLIFAPTSHAAEKSDTKKDEKPPVTVTVQAGDTLTSIADAQSTTYVRLFDANDFISNPDIIDVGQVVRIPTADEQLPDRYAAVSAAQVAPVVYSSSRQVASSAPRANSTTRTTTYASSAGNTYYYGYCTWYAKQRRPDLPNMLGNGGQWVANAAARGYSTGTAPRAGAIAETTGHVAYVESVNGNGTIVISEMNGPAGFGVVGTRTVPASQYRYIY
jgi:surface antigen